MKIPDLKPLLPPPPPPAISPDDPAAPHIPHPSSHTPYTFPNGLLIQEDFITPAHEANLINNIFRKELDWPDRKGRLSLHYGYTFSYKTFGIDEDVPFKEFPEWLVPLIPLLPVQEGEEDGVDGAVRGRLVDLAVGEVHDEEESKGGKEGSGDDGVEGGEAGGGKGKKTKRRISKGRPPDQVCLQYYAPGTGIPPHVDTHSTYDELYALSLGAPVMMQFRRDYHGDDDNAHTNGNNRRDPSHPTQPSSSSSPTANENHRPSSGDDKNGTKTPNTTTSPTTKRTQLDIDLPPRSLLCMSADSRLHWTHGIKSRKTDTLPDGTVRARGDRWSITYRWLRKERPFHAEMDPPYPTGPIDGTGAGRASEEKWTDDVGGNDGKGEEEKVRMVRECECGDLALCDTAQRRQGREREYRWKEYEKKGGGALASAS